MSKKAGGESKRGNKTIKDQSSVSEEETFSRQVSIGLVTIAISILLLLGLIPLFLVPGSLTITLVISLAVFVVAVIAFFPLLTQLSKDSSAPIFVLLVAVCYGAVGFILLANILSSLLVDNVYLAPVLLLSWLCLLPLVFKTVGAILNSTPLPKLRKDNSRESSGEKESSSKENGKGEEQPSLQTVVIAAGTSSLIPFYLYSLAIVIISVALAVFSLVV